MLSIIYFTSFMSAHLTNQTFIRNAPGRALRDSPALNAHSRAVLVPLARAEAPRAIVVPGPGPTESHSSEPAPLVKNEEAPPSIPSPLVLPSAEAARRDDRGGGDGEEDEPKSPGPAKDPYSNLDGAFGNYLQADDPKPINRGRNADDDDLLF